jgi:hypothetical protein
MRLRYYLYIVSGVAASICLMTDPELHAMSHITELIRSLSILSHEVFAAIP